VTRRPDQWVRLTRRAPSPDEIERRALQLCQKWFNVIGPDFDPNKRSCWDYQPRRSASYNHDMAELHALPGVDIPATLAKLQK
jgi:hypothetical protein